MDTSASNCSISRITIGSFSSDDENLIQELKNLAEESGETDFDEDSPDQWLYRWLEDVDDLLYFDGPLYDENICINIGEISVKIYELLKAGSQVKVVDESMVEMPNDSILSYTEMLGRGSLEYLSICGDEESLEALCRSNSQENIAEIAQHLEILIKKIETPIGELQMFVGLAYKANEYIWQDHWGDGSYENYVNTEEAYLMKRTKDGFNRIEDFRMNEILAAVYSALEE